ncbi:DegV family EDD domain-containing protein [Desulfopila sp. IMCC35006]|uniref:DegV family protein n=1 Tax=Desulfopila sp. IMCC35006 TaxID=2569542 RepID=UPI0010AB50F8|nr:DegV family protein [Desulfopila sp. IMCC35006]TKB28258.1 DegV family EDD domain-containing protein [Desulfopila sp. IMCC35006]
MNSLEASFAAGYACLSAWADLLDRINVYPVADGDTGTNLRISLAPFRDPEKNSRTAYEQLARCATGNSGNIAAAFFREFCQAQSSAELAEKAASGREKAWGAVSTPCAGTMLNVFDSLAQVLAAHDRLDNICLPLRLELQQAVDATTQLLPDLKAAGVVDSGALAMYLFFDGFFGHLTGQKDSNRSILELFAGKLVIRNSYRPVPTDCYCVDVVLRVADHHAAVRDSIAELGNSVVAVEDESLLKVHIHSPDPDRLRGRLGSYGDIVQWSASQIDQGGAEQSFKPAEKTLLHIVTDGAGSIPREMASAHGITLLDSYIITGESSRPESLYRPDHIYPLMRAGHKVTTAQASTFERHQHYRSICQQFGRCLYLCVGSAFTGNYGAAMAWKKDHDPENLLTVVDTGAASGRLALIALLTARKASKASSEDAILHFVQKAMAACREYVFIDELKYLVAGGRVSKAGGFFGDLLSMKPVVSPTGDGVRKVGVVHSRSGQLSFAMTRLGERFDRTAAPLVMLQYSDNRAWVTDTVVQKVRALLPQAEILLTPLSLTSGVHMGPGTWSLAFAAAEIDSL